MYQIIDSSGSQSGELQFTTLGRTGVCIFMGWGEGEASNLIPRITLLSWAKGLFSHLLLTTLEYRMCGEHCGAPCRVPQASECN